MEKLFNMPVTIVQQTLAAETNSALFCSGLKLTGKSPAQMTTLRPGPCL